MNSLTPAQIAEASKLVSDIRKWKAAYYNGQSLVTDQVYDGAEMRLKQLIPDHPVFSEVGAAPDGFETINYVEKGAGKMMSLDKVYSAGEVENFVGGREYVSMVKLDGLSLRAEYENCKLTLAHTRGNGSVGDADAVADAGVCRRRQADALPAAAGGGREERNHPRRQAARARIDRAA